ncbi:transposase [Streptomyces sp. NPDC050264]|uniref:transposase n=1 Tax=Streptomyces sp. NPDC050264 TaxID=3155038 RepID=UPI0034227E5E
MGPRAWGLLREVILILDDHVLWDVEIRRAASGTDLSRCCREASSRAAPAWTRRQLMDGIRWRTRMGAPWRDAPERYRPWDRAHDLFRHRQRDGTWARIVAQLQAEADAKGLITWDVNVDPTVRRAHQHAAGAAKRGISRRNRPAGSPSSRPAKGSDAPGRPDQQDPPRRRAGSAAAIGGDHRRTAG